ncbi:peptide ABC transporter permease [Psychromonas sp. psych-6C06]|uniref:ABC transporter permease subunit n=1 Tax=Psychromonas sp. psych-6C06 TaxID=2058089 RepID=UPI000C3285A7|nr:ABC transporter permease subunit [Psychromonas sp. psych-6C06]PKF61146.1 peptide ABC transporter permease [Psychromonas sp. psych-6C06]
MFNYFIRRLYLLAITAFILSILAFLIEHWTVHNHTDLNIFTHYFDYVIALLNGDFGLSSVDQKPIISTGLVAFASTLELCFFAFLFSSIVGIPLGIFAGLDRNQGLDYTIMSVALIGLALPVFWVAIIFTILPNLLGWVMPIDGNISPIFEVPVITGFLFFDSLLVSDKYDLDAFYNHLVHIILPSSVLAIFLLSEIIRLTRHAITMVMKSNYIKAAHTKGLRRRQIVFRHVLKNALPPIIHQLRLQISTIISFAMAIEIVFAYQGAGMWLFASIQQGDYIALSTALLIISGFILISSILVDLLLVIISPTKRKTLYADQ